MALMTRPTMNSPGRGTSVLAGAGPSPPQPSPKPSPHRCEEGPVQPLGRSCLQVAQRSLGQAGQSSGPWHRPGTTLTYHRRGSTEQTASGSRVRSTSDLQTANGRRASVIPRAQQLCLVRACLRQRSTHSATLPGAPPTPKRLPAGSVNSRGAGVGAERRLQRGSSLEAGGQGAGGGRWPAVCCSNRPGVLAPVPVGWEG